MLSYGYRLKIVRITRGMTQQELGIAAGFSPDTAGIRIAQYEAGDRVPRKDISGKIAGALSIKESLLSTPIPTTSEELEAVQFWTASLAGIGLGMIDKLMK